MKPNAIKFFVSFSPLLLLVTSCKKLEQIEHSPKISPDEFLRNQHWISIDTEWASFIWSQPSSSIVVYFVGLFAIYSGYRFLANTGSDRTKKWWGIGLILSGLGALFAGTSYQAFGYEIKCSGREWCSWTSWWEVAYLFLSVPGMNSFLIATAYSNAKSKFRTAIIAYAVINSIAYAALLFYGAFTANMLLLSFDFMVMFSAISVILLIIVHGIAYAKSKDSMNLRLRNVWLIMVIVGVAYAVYLMSGLTQQLWENGIWFTENDVLHLGMCYWIYYVLTRLPEEIKDIR